MVGFVAKIVAGLMASCTMFNLVLISLPIATLNCIRYYFLNNALIYNDVGLGLGLATLFGTGQVWSLAPFFGHGPGLGSKKIFSRPLRILFSPK